MSSYYWWSPFQNPSGQLNGGRGRLLSLLDGLQPQSFFAWSKPSFERGRNPEDRRSGEQILRRGQFGQICCPCRKNGLWTQVEGLEERLLLLDGLQKSRKIQAEKSARVFSQALHLQETLMISFTGLVDQSKVSEHNNTVISSNSLLYLIDSSNMEINF